MEWRETEHKARALLRASELRKSLLQALPKAGGVVRHFFEDELDLREVLDGYVSGKYSEPQVLAEIGRHTRELGPYHDDDGTISWIEVGKTGVVATGAVVLAVGAVVVAVEIHMCEIDEQVVEVGKKFFSKTLATAFDDSRVKLFIDDAARYLREEGAGQNYDVIICDSSDPVGPADVLFQPEFFLSMKNALRPETGVICTQGECQWLHLDFIRSVWKSLVFEKHKTLQDIAEFVFRFFGFLSVLAFQSLSD
eukprot:gene29864-33708_t